MRIRRGHAVLIAVGMLGAGLVPFAGAAAAATLACGQTITTSVTLTANVGPCPNNGIIIGADNITLNLNGFSITGTPNAGDGAGVYATGRTGVLARGGTVSNFDGGVVIDGGGRNTITQ